MSKGPDRERARILDAVSAGEMMPAQAEEWARTSGREPFEKRPDVSALDPMKEELWTLPMAAAWFIWRSPDAVRDQWNLARKSWTKWTPRRDPLLTVPPRPNRPRWRLKVFRRASLDDVFAEAGFHPWRKSQSDFHRTSVGRLFRGSAAGGSKRQADNPYARFEFALQSGRLPAIRVRPGGQEREQIPAEHWSDRAEIEDFELLKYPPSHDENTTPSSTKPIDQSTLAPAGVEASLDLSGPLDDDSEIPEPLLGDPSDGDIYVLRKRAIEAEREVSQRAFAQPDWGLEQALGWLAYQNEKDFRSLGAAELKPPTYFGEKYPPDFTNPQPVEALRQALISGVLKGYYMGKEVAPAEWLDMAIWDAHGVIFRRDDVLRVFSKKPVALNARAETAATKELASHLRVNRDMRRSEAVNLLNRPEFTIKSRPFRRVWRNARKEAGLEEVRKPGRPKTSR
jgi:hypothetical protein